MKSLLLGRMCSLATRALPTTGVLLLCIGGFAARASAQPVTVSSVADLTTALVNAAAGTVTTIRIMPGTYDITSPLSVDAPGRLVLENAGGGRVTLQSASGEDILQVGFASSFGNVVVRGLTFSGTTLHRAAISSRATIVVADSAFVGNDVGFYLDRSSAVVEFVNDTFNQNGSGCAGIEPCGGIWIESGSARAWNVTVAGNAGYGVKGVNWLVNSIVFGNASRDCFDVPLFRLASIDGGTCHATTADPHLSALADNGGLTQTMALPPTGAALNAGFTSLCPATDQRGMRRDDGSCDIGAFEAPSGAPVPAPAPSSYVTVGSVTDLLSAVATAASSAGTHEIRLKAGTYHFASHTPFDVPRGDTLILRNAGDGPVILEGVIAPGWSFGKGNYVLEGLTMSGIEGYGDSVLIVDSTVTGLGFYTDGSNTNVALVNDTFTANRDGIYLDSYRYVTATNVTASGNSRYGLKDVPNLRNSIVYGNGLDCRGAGVTDSSIDGDGTCGAITNDPILTALADNGGPTKTMAVGALSAAINAANDLFCPALDQRGALRRDAGCDVGAYERSKAVRIESVTGAGPVVVAANGGTFTQFQAVDPNSLPASGAPSSVTFPFGMFEWTISGLPVAQPVAVSLSLPSSVPTPPQYWQFDRGTGLWTEMCAQLSCSVDPASPNVLRFTITDGGPGDLDGSANGVIQDPGGPGAGGALAYSLSIDDVSIPEGSSGTSNATFKVTLSPASSQTVTVKFATGNGTADSGPDYVAVNLTPLTFNPNETTKTIVVAVNGDTTPEPSETFFVNLSAPTNATIAKGQGVGTIENDDFTLSIDDISVNEGNAGTTNATFTVTLSGASSQEVTVAFAAADGTATVADHDYVVTADTLTFAPGETSKPITVPIRGDTRFETDETFSMDLSNAVGATIADDRGIGTIANDEQRPTVSVSNVTVTEGASGTTPAVFTVTLSAASGLPASADFATADTNAVNTARFAEGDYQFTSGTLTFNPGETTKQVTVFVYGDTHFEDDEQFFVNLSNPVNLGITDPNGGGFSRVAGIGTILSDERTIVSISNVMMNEGNAGTTSAVFDVTLCGYDTSIVPINCGPSDREVKVDFATADSSATVADGDYQAVAGALTFNPFDRAKQIIVAVQGDTRLEPGETFFVKLSNPVHAMFPGGNILGVQVVGTLVNDDVPSATGAGPVFFSSSAGTFSSLTAVAEGSLPTAGKPAGVAFPFGFFDWTIVGLTNGQAVTVTMTFPSAVPAPPQYWKVIGGVWTNVCAQLSCVALGNVLQITFTDGGPGDLDASVNGQIHDPGGLGIGAVEACHYVSVALAPPTVPQGGLTTVTATVRSCARVAQTVTVRFTLAGPQHHGGCGGTNSLMFTTPPFTLAPGTVRTLRFPFLVPSSACPGTYSITATTLLNGIAVDTTSTSLTVTPR